MVNYRYDQASIEKNHEAYAAAGKVACSPRRAAACGIGTCGPPNPAVDPSVQPQGQLRPMTWNYHADPSVTSLPALVRARMRDPAKVFIRNGDGRTFTYGEIWDLAGRLAGALRAHGVAVGDRVAVQVDKSPEAIVLFLACARAGAVFLPLNTAYTLNEVDYFVGDAEPRVIVAAPATAAELADLGARHKVGATLSLGTAGDGTLMERPPPSSRPSSPTRPLGWDDLAAILYTSGTTGRSKGAMLTHGNLASNALALIEAWRFTDRDVLIHALPVYHTHGLFAATNTLLLVRRDDALPGEVRCRRGHAADAGGDGDDGRADLLHPPPPASRPDRARRRRTCACSSPARRRSSPRPTANSRRGPATPSSSATA